MRLAFMCVGLGAVLAVVGATTGALGDVSRALSAFGPDSNKGPLIIHIQKSTSLSQGTADVYKQTRCLLQWSGGKRGQYDKQCETSNLPR